MRRPRSHSGYVRFAMENLGLTYGKAMEYADDRLEEKSRGQRSSWDQQDSLFQDSEQARADSIPTQDEAGDARPHGVPCPAPAPSKDSGRGTDGSRGPGSGSAVRPQPRPEYDPRTSDWQGF